ncbi:TfoX/Sxy family DNA transformation protein [Klebsiella oxytoca]|uniref:TfoX/Sxy family DNA transformation protein n=1 Tax=Klebsiella oxytoca TaxID=571 RepID=UPI00157AEFA9|nr:TfoX/Sxy family DNA transformation protein [Klebsiella oxytoca]
MKKITHQRFHQFQECLSSLGKIRCRPLFGGYSLAIENTVFAMATEGEVYLKLCEQSAGYHVVKAAPLLIMRKNGRPVLLKYYQIDETLWRDSKMLLKLSVFSLQTARNEKNQLRATGRLKDLPNISFQMELMLIHVGVTDEQTLRNLGAQDVWLKLRESNKALSLNFLYALEGAIVGVHAAALPTQRRRELAEWAGGQHRDIQGYSG